jgi:hypothetical protein
MEPVLYPLKALVRCGLIVAFSLSVLAQIPAVPDASGVRLRRTAPDFPLTALPLALTIPRPVFEFRGIRIGEGMKEAERKFLSLKVPSLSSKSGLCGSGGIHRIETCTDVLDTGEYVNITILDRRVAQIYVSTDRRTQGNTYEKYVLGLGAKYGEPDRLETRYYRNDIETGSSGERLRWLNKDQYMEGSQSERSITIGSRALDTEIARIGPHL